MKIVNVHYLPDRFLLTVLHGHVEGFVQGLLTNTFVTYVQVCTCIFLLLLYPVGHLARVVGCIIFFIALFRLYVLVIVPSHNKRELLVHL